MRDCGRNAHVRQIKKKYFKLYQTEPFYSYFDFASSERTLHYKTLHDEITGNHQFDFKQKRHTHLLIHSSMAKRFAGRKDDHFDTQNTHNMQIKKENQQEKNTHMSMGQI